MALTIKRKQTLETGDFDLSSIIKECIKSLIMGRLTLRKDTMIKWVEYFPAYKTCEYTCEKTLSSIFLKLKYEPSYTRIAAKEIEISGATIIEFIDYLEEKGAKEMLSTENILESI